MGKIIGMAIFDRKYIPTFFTQSLYKHFLKIPLNFIDL